jgi:hypothetical protein
MLSEIGPNFTESGQLAQGWMKGMEQPKELLYIMCIIGQLITTGTPAREPLLSRDSERVVDRGQVGPAQRARSLELTLKTVSHTSTSPRRGPKL